MSLKSRSQKRKLPRGIDLYDDLYRARLSHAGVQHLVGYFFTVADAEAALANARSEIARGIFVPPVERRRQEREEARRASEQAEKDQRTIHELKDEWLIWLNRRGRKHGTTYTYERHLKAHFLNEFGDRSPTSIDSKEILQWYSDLAAGTSQSNASGVYRTIASMFRYAAGTAQGLDETFERWIDESPCKVPGGASNMSSKPRHKVLATPEQIRQMAEAMPEGDALIVLLGGYAGLRIGEVLALRRRDIVQDEKDDSVWVRVSKQIQARGSGVREEAPKSEDGKRTIPIPEWLAHEVQQYLKDQVGQHGDALLFPRTPGGSTWHNPNTIGKRFKRAKEQLVEKDSQENGELLNFTFHDLRHTYLTTLANSGATIEELQKLGGHRDINSVMVYQHAGRDRLVGLANTLPSPEI
ncbi:MAG: tyrosine-type recombinase/integrase [Yaniella sp.]|nr:tyrosine-type recombinase/integrase [Yaniella sp.]MDN6150638.1 tyrosine-type recombinase/integrase [Yaniella sp.]MDN6532655.1 tyrosine-type recombinase/integrase [Yaniella sp.]